MDNKLSTNDLVQLGQQFGTPLYVYNAQSIVAQYNKLQQAFSNWPTKFFLRL
jgi:diaminopimelate decarboxylase